MVGLFRGRLVTMVVIGPIGGRGSTVMLVLVVIQRASMDGYRLRC